MDPKLLLKNRWLLALGIVGIICLVVGSLWNGRSAANAVMASVQTPSTTNANGVGASQVSTPTASDSSPSAISAIEATDAAQMQQMLGKLAGVNAIAVMVSVSGSNQLTLANSVRSTSDTTGNGHSVSTDKQPFTESVNGSTLPVVVASTPPQVSGVLVLVNAQDFYLAKAEIIDAITNVWDVPAYNISVEPEK